MIMLVICCIDAVGGGAVRTIHTHDGGRTCSDIGCYMCRVKCVFIGDVRVDTLVVRNGVACML